MPEKSSNTRAAILTLSTALLVFSFARPALAGLIANGGFELAANGTPNTVGQVNVITTLQGWGVGPSQNNGDPAAVYVADQNADVPGMGIPAQGGATGYLWGPGTGANNGFTGSPDGGHFLAVGGDYKVATVSQTITGLTAGAQYDLTFDWAGAQATDASGPVAEWWDVSFGGSSVDTQHYQNPGQGFSGWSSFSTTFTATSGSEVLQFLASADPFTNGTPAGLAPVLLLDDVTLTELPPVNSGSSTPEPGTSALMLSSVAAAWGALRLRKWAKR